MSFQIEINQNGISVRKEQKRELLDPITGEKVVVEEGYLRQSIGLGDFCKDPMSPTETELDKFRAEIGRITAGMVGEQFSSWMADTMAYATANQELRLRSALLEQTVNVQDKDIEDLKVENAELRAKIKLVTVQFHANEAILRQTINDLEAKAESLSDQLQEIEELLENEGKQS